MGLSLEGFGGEFEMGRIAFEWEDWILGRKEKKGKGGFSFFLGIDLGYGK